VLQVTVRKPVVARDERCLREDLFDLSFVLLTGSWRAQPKDFNQSLIINVRWHENMIKCFQ
jgi:hypothetical protein